MYIQYIYIYIYPFALYSWLDLFNEEVIDLYVHIDTLEWLQAKIFSNLKPTVGNGWNNNENERILRASMYALHVLCNHTTVYGSNFDLSASRDCRSKVLWTVSLMSVIVRMKMFYSDFTTLIWVSGQSKCTDNWANERSVWLQLCRNKSLSILSEVRLLSGWSELNSA
jgi:hypothetical protein